MQSGKQGHFKREFARKYFVRFHMSLIVAGTIGGGVRRLGDRRGQGNGDPFCVVFAMTMVLAYFIQDLCPPAGTLREAVYCLERMETFTP